MLICEVNKYEECLKMTVYIQLCVLVIWLWNYSLAHRTKNFASFLPSSLIIMSVQRVTKLSAGSMTKTWFLSIIHRTVCFSNLSRVTQRPAIKHKTKITFVQPCLSSWGCTNTSDSAGNGINVNLKKFIQISWLCAFSALNRTWRVSPTWAGSHATANVPHQKTTTDNSSAIVAGHSYSPAAKHSCFHAVQETGQVPEVFNNYTSERTHYHSPWRHQKSKEVMCPVI